MFDMTVAKRQEIFSRWIAEGSLREDGMHLVAYRNGIFGRQGRYHHPAYGFSDYLNAAAIRQLTQGEG